ncbi:MAG: response regulator [Gammaproteobacteria bacterium]|nr:response regulator [Gammaproteobacteria bacterium]
MSANARILVVDDDERVRRLLSCYLVREGYAVRQASDGDQMRSRLSVEGTDLIILDLMLPGEDGLSLATELRARSDIPIIMLTGKTSNSDKVVGLELGADDYITKPFDRRELLARVRTVLRRTSRHVQEAASTERTSAHFAGWTLDIVAHELKSPAGEYVELTTSEFKLLLALVIHHGRVLSRDEALELISGRDWNPMDRSVDVMVGKLRRKLEPEAHESSIIKTIRGVGYMLAANVTYENRDQEIGGE